MTRRASHLAALLLSCLFCAPIAAQTKGTISGYTKDASGAFVAGVNITVINEQTGAKRMATSDATGFTRC